jgi:predicted Zn-dependent peptidase
MTPGMGEPVALRLSDGFSINFHPGREENAASSLVVRVEDSTEQKRKGLAHFVEHLLARHLRQTVFPDAIEQSPADEDWEAVTSLEGIRFLWFNLRSESGAAVAAGFVRAVRGFPEAMTLTAFDAERPVVLAELDWLREMEEHDPDVVVRKLALATAFPGTALGVGEPAGIRAEVEKVGFRELAEYAACLLKPANCTVILVVGGPQRVRDDAVRSLCDL